MCRVYTSIITVDKQWPQNRDRNNSYFCVRVYTHNYYVHIHTQQGTNITLYFFENICLFVQVSFDVFRVKHTTLIETVQSVKRRIIAYSYDHMMITDSC